MVAFAPLTSFTPVGPFAEVKARAAAAVEAASPQLIELSHRIHANPEPAFEERLASAACADMVERAGYTVERGAGTLETAVRPWY